MGRRQWAKLPLLVGVIVGLVLSLHEVSVRSATGLHSCGLAVFNDPVAAGTGRAKSACERAAARWNAGSGFAFWAAILGYVLVRFRPLHRKWSHPARIPALLGIAVLGAVAGLSVAVVVNPRSGTPSVVVAVVIGAAVALLVPLGVARRWRGRSSTYDQDGVVATNQPDMSG
jgi:peptidoglycan/LPS O-acetylase OafA/YrhL